MSHIKISRSHNLGHGECEQLAEELLDRLVDHYGGAVKKDRNTFRYSHRSGMSAVVETGEDALDIAIRLTMMTRAFGPKIEQQLNRILDEHLG